MKKIVAFYDKKTNSWSDPVTVPNLPTACRMAEQLTRREGSIHSQYPGDFDLYHVGDWSESEDGKLTITQLTPAVLVCSCSDFVKVENNG